MEVIFYTFIFVPYCFEHCVILGMTAIPMIETVKPQMLIVTILWKKKKNCLNNNFGLIAYFVGVGVICKHTHAHTPTHAHTHASSFFTLNLIYLEVWNKVEEKYATFSVEVFECQQAVNTSDLSFIKLIWLLSCILTKVRRNVFVFFFDSQ